MRGATEAGGHFVIDRPLLRGANADVNLTLAIALVFFACWMVWGVREHGVGGMFADLFLPKGESKGALRFLLIVVFFATEQGLARHFVRAMAATFVVDPSLIAGIRLRAAGELFDDTVGARLAALEIG